MMFARFPNGRVFVSAITAAALAMLPLGSGARAQGADTHNVNPLIGEENSEAKQGDAWFDNYRFKDGETIEKVHIHYETMGEPHRGKGGRINNAVLVLHWTGSNSRALLTPRYVKALFDPGRPLDARKYFLIFPDSIGHGESSKPSDGLRAKFPNYGYLDMVDLQHKLIVETLGIEHLHAILGMSMGGMNAWQWAEAYPGFMDGIMPVVSLPVKVSGRNLIWRRTAVDYIQGDSSWNGGNYSAPPRGWIQAYELLRLMIDGVPHMQATAPNLKEADRFIDDAKAEAARGDANDVLWSLKSSSDYDPEPELDRIRTKVFALNFDDDEFNPDVLKILQTRMQRVKSGRYIVQAGSASSFGHLTMAHPELWSKHVAEFMRELED
jgi:homoserine O-acetyltransferase/O-succinyltransferase